jgi:hypothetical protein
MNYSNYSQNEEQWIPILDYAVLRGVSTSTLRRYIKAKKIRFKVENGRYLLLADTQLANQYRLRQTQQPQIMVRPNWDGANPPMMVDQSKVRELEEKLYLAQEQITELKMLVATYEEMLARSGQ